MILDFLDKGAKKNKEVFQIKNGITSLIATIGLVISLGEHIDFIDKVTLGLIGSISKYVPFVLVTVTIIWSYFTIISKKSTPKENQKKSDNGGSKIYTSNNISRQFSKIIFLVSVPLFAISAYTITNKSWHIKQPIAGQIIDDLGQIVPNATIRILNEEQKDITIGFPSTDSEEGGFILNCSEPVNQYCTVKIYSNNRSYKFPLSKEYEFPSSMVGFTIFKFKISTE